MRAGAAATRAGDGGAAAAAAADGAPFPLLALPADVLSRLLARLDGRSLAALSSVCRPLRAAASTSTAWRAAYEAEFGARERAHCSRSACTVFGAPAEAHRGGGGLQLPLPLAAADVRDWRIVFRKRLEAEANWAAGNGSLRLLDGASRCARRLLTRHCCPLLGRPSLAASMAVQRFRSAPAGHRDAMRHAQMSADGCRLLSMSSSRQQADCSVRVWDSASGRCTAVLRTDDAIAAAAVDGDWVAVACENGAALLWDTRRGGTAAWQGGAAMACAGVDAAAQVAAVGTAAGRVHTWDLRRVRAALEAATCSGAPRIEAAPSGDAFEAPCGEPVTLLQASDGLLACIAGAIYGNAYLLACREGAQLGPQPLWTAPAQWTRTLSFDAVMGRLVLDHRACAEESAVLRLWDLHAGKPLRDLHLARACTAAARRLPRQHKAGALASPARVHMRLLPPPPDAPLHPASPAAHRRLTLTAGARAADARPGLRDPVPPLR